ncbi:MAG: hypothetical protein ACK5U6_14045 [Pseudanabaena sp.]
MTRVSLYNIKQRSHPHHPQNPITFSLKSNSDRTHTTHKPDHLNSTSNSDRKSFYRIPLANRL